MRTLFGIDNLLADQQLQARLRGKRLALLGHPASLTNDFRHSMDALFSAGLKLSAAFGPQHGMHGEKQDNMVETADYPDPHYGIPVFSLYGEVRRPTPRMLETFDIILIDLQDVGTRIYTFLTTLCYVLEECGKAGKQVWVLDRPNPAGRPVEGSLLQPGWKSFVGAAEGLPMRHGLTLGEAAQWFKARLKIDVELTVVKMSGYKPDDGPGFGWPLLERSWVNPSPNAATLNMARVYPGSVLIEGTHLSEGRGTTRALEVMGAPDLDMPKLLKWMQAQAPEWLKGAHVRACYFQPTFHKHAGQICQGLQFHTDDDRYSPSEFKPYRAVALWLKAIRHHYSEYQIWRDFHYEYEKDRLAFDLINGGPLLREWVDNKAAAPQDLEKILAGHEQTWLNDRKEFLLY